MRIAVLTGLFACALIFVSGTQTSSAQESEVARIAANEITNNRGTYVVSLLTIEPDTALKVIVDDEVNDNNQAQPTEQIPKEPTKHVVTENETLTTIAEKYQTIWKRIYDKNTTIENPDFLTVGLELVIPNADEQLTERELPQPVVVEERQPAVERRSQQATPAVRTATAPRGNANGNGYVAGYCTWYVKNKRPDLPNNLGNAISWVSRASSQGIATGSTPSVGAVGQRGNHVVYVESVNDDGTVTISEMNHKGLYVITTRTLPANYFSYIY